ncbi:hypothetical protein EON82_08915 [bacterium]|nr:MAG: hypothetical protein EON82_08915 [bacterium]
MRLPNCERKSSGTRWRCIDVTRRERFRSALGSLNAFCAEPIENDRDVAGILQGFAFTFELAWKVVQDEIERRGYAERGPRLALAAGLKAGLIAPEDADPWSDALEDRTSLPTPIVQTGREVLPIALAQTTSRS